MSRRIHPQVEDGNDIDAAVTLGEEDQMAPDRVATVPRASFVNCTTSIGLLRDALDRAADLGPVRVSGDVSSESVTSRPTLDS